MSANNSHDRERIMDKQRDDSILQAGVTAGMDDAEDPSTEYLREITGSSLQPATIDILDNLLSRDFVLSNIDAAEDHELKWLTRVLQQKVEAMHPPEGSILQGEYRAFVFDDPTDTLESLNAQERVEIETFLLGFTYGRHSRAKHGWQQEKFSETITRSEVVDNKEESESFIKSLLS